MTPPQPISWPESSNVASFSSSESARSICDIGFDDSLSQDEELATKGKDDAVEKLVSFWGRAVELSKQKGNEQPFLMIMAPPSCKAVDFLIYCQAKRLPFRDFNFEIIQPWH